MAAYVLGIDQSTQGTKALLFDGEGNLICRTDLPHKQIVTEQGWVQHDPEEIYRNTVQVVKDLVEKAGIDKNEIQVLGISNQRETALVWEKETGKPIYDAVVWHCARGAAVCDEIEKAGHAEKIQKATGLKLSPYFSAGKIAWILQNVEGAMDKARNGELCCGTIDSWLVYKLTGHKEFKTDYSNAARTQLFNIHTLNWDSEICKCFNIPEDCLAKVIDSNGEFGKTDFDGYLDHEIAIHSAMGDSNGALFGQGCLERGMIKTTYGTGSSIMMNIGKEPIFGEGIVTSLAWSKSGEVNYVMEGNINYTGAVISWLKNDLQLIQSPGETGDLAKAANPQDTTYLVPAFSGLGAPYWDSEAKAVIYGMSRATGKAEIVKAAVESIAYQITDVVKAMEEQSGIKISELRVDGGPTKNDYLMQFQSDMAQIPVQVPSAEELSGIGAAYMAGIGAGIYSLEKLLNKMDRTKYVPVMSEENAAQKYAGWKEAVSRVLTK